MIMSLRIVQALKQKSLKRNGYLRIWMVISLLTIIQFSSQRWIRSNLRKLILTMITTLWQLICVSQIRKLKRIKRHTVQEANMLCRLDHLIDIGVAMVDAVEDYVITHEMYSTTLVNNVTKIFVQHVSPK